MSRRLQDLMAAGGLRGTLVSNVGMRVVEVSISGGLFESTTPLKIGTTGLLQLTAAGGEYDDHVRVVCCAHVEGAGSLHRIAVEFLWTRPTGDHTVRALAWDIQRHREAPGRATTPE